MLLSTLAASRAQAEEVPRDLGLLVMLKVLTYDAAFEGRLGAHEFLVLVPFGKNTADIAKNIVTAAAALPIKAMLGRTLRFEAIPSGELETQLVTRQAGAVFIPTGTSAELATSLAAVATKHNRYGMTLDEELVKTGITVGVALNSGKAQVILNVVAARAIKAEFSSAVMRVARIQQ